MGGGRLQQQHQPQQQQPQTQQAVLVIVRSGSGVNHDSSGSNSTGGYSSICQQVTVARVFVPVIPDSCLPRVGT